MSETIDVVAYTVSGEPAPVIKVFETTDEADAYIGELRERSDPTEVERRTVDLDDLDGRHRH